MISFNKLWDTMEAKNANTNTLRNKHPYYSIGSKTVKRLRRNEGVSTHTLNALCQILDCQIEDIMELLPDEPNKTLLI